MFSPARYLMIYLAKATHRVWAGPWFSGPLNPHKKGSFGWNQMHGSKEILKA